jgi:hypothetical protein
LSNPLKANDFQLRWSQLNNCRTSTFRFNILVSLVTLLVLFLTVRFSRDRKYSYYLADITNWNNLLLSTLGNLWQKYRMNEPVWPNTCIFTWHQASRALWNFVRNIFFPFRVIAINIMLFLIDICSGRSWRYWALSLLLASMD